MANGGRLGKFVALVVIFMTVLAGPGAGALARPAVDVNGTTYTSPTYGFSATWPDSWFVVDETSDPPKDDFTISDGLSYVEIISDELPGNPGLVLAGLIGGLVGDASISNAQVLTDANGQQMRDVAPTKASATYGFTFTADDGSVVDLVEYFEVRPIVAGTSSLIIEATTRADTYASEAGNWQQISDSITFPTPPPLVGEPAPVFVSGPWRIAIATAAIDAAFPTLGLSTKSGKEWVVAVADVSNWSTTDATFNLRDTKLQTSEMPKAVSVAPNSVSTAATSLGLEPKTGTTVPIAAGASQRVVLVYSVAEGGSEPRLMLGDQTLPLDNAIDPSVDQAALTRAAVPAELAKGKVTAVVDNNTLKVRIGGKTKTVTFLGVDVVGASACFGEQATAYVAKLQGRTVLLETDDKLTVKDAYYVWIEHKDGTRTMVNDDLIDAGYARSRALPTLARFQVWLDEDEAEAQTSKMGLWSGCPTPTPPPTATATATRPPSNTATATPAASPTSTPSQTASPTNSPSATPTTSATATKPPSS